MPAHIMISRASSILSRFRDFGLVAFCILAISGNFKLGRGQPACSYQPDTADFCSESGFGLCEVQESVGQAFRAACQTTCRVCKTRRQLDNEVLQAGGTVEIRTGFVLDQGNAADLDLIKGFELWLSRSGAGTEEGIQVGNGIVKVRHFTDFAVADAACAGHHAAARRLIEEHQIDFAVIQKHTCKTNLSHTYDDAGIVHFLQSGTNMVNDAGEAYENKLSWYLHLSSDDYPRLFLKQMDFHGSRNVSVVYYEGHDWARTSAQTLVSNIQGAFDKGQSKMQVVHTYSWPAEAGGKGLDAVYDDAMWEELLEGYEDSRAQVLVVYSIDEGLSLMNKVAQMRAPVHGVYITVAPTKTAWQQLGDDGNYVVTPGQWSDMALSPCVVFGSISNYVDLFEETHGFVPNYNVAMSSFAGVVIQLAMQHAGSIVSEDITDALSIMTYDTLMGRVRFSAEKRNIGRDPVLMQVQGDNLNLVLPAELAVAPLMNFVVWECRVLIHDNNPSQCSDEEFAVFENCFDRYRDRIDGTACLLRLEAERVKQWDGPQAVDLCSNYGTASEATQALAEYNDLGSADLILQGCEKGWFEGETLALPKLRVIGGKLVIKDLGASADSLGRISVSLPSLQTVRGDLVLEGQMQPGANVLLPNLAEVYGALNVMKTIGFLDLYLPKVKLIRGGVHFERNSAIAGLQLPLLKECGNILLDGNKGRLDTAGGFLITLPQLEAVHGGFVVTNNDDLAAIIVPQLEVLGGKFYVVGNHDLIEMSFAVLYDIQGEEIIVQENDALAFINLAQGLVNVTYCDTFAEGDMSGNDALLNIRTLWFEVHNCPILQKDDRANICPHGFVLVHGEGSESRCDQDWRAYFRNVLILAAGSIIGVSVVYMYQAQQYKTFYCRPEFTGGRPISSGLCNFNWHASSATLLLSTVDMVSDVIFIQVQIDDIACRDYRWIITASLWVLIVSSAVSALRVAVLVLQLSLDKHRYIHFFPIPAPGYRWSLINWAWCIMNGVVNLLLVLICVTGLEPLRALPWDRPTTEKDIRVLEGREYMPDWHRFSQLEKIMGNDDDDNDAELEAISAQSGWSAVRKSVASGRLAHQHSIAEMKGISAGGKMMLYISTLSFFDQSIGIIEDVGQFVLQMFFLVSCHPTESAALTTLLSLMFSFLRAGLKLTGAMSDDIIMDSVQEAKKTLSSFLHEKGAKSIFGDSKVASQVDGADEESHGIAAEQYRTRSLAWTAD